MTVSVALYLGLLAVVGLGRLIEMRLSRRHQRALAAQGAALAPEPGFRLMVALHAGVLLASAAEVWWLRRPFVAAVGVPAFVLFAAANGLRWWVIATLGPHWNVRVVRSLSLGVVTSGPYRWIRHPNYVAVFAELLALPLIHTAWITAVLGAGLHAVVLRQRLTVEETVLTAAPAYRLAMGDRPRFVPRLRRGRAPGVEWPTS